MRPPEHRCDHFYGPPEAVRTPQVARNSTLNIPQNKSISDHSIEFHSFRTRCTQFTHSLARVNGRKTSRTSNPERLCTVQWKKDIIITIQSNSSDERNERWSKQCARHRKPMPFLRLLFYCWIYGTAIAIACVCACVCVRCVVVSCKPHDTATGSQCHNTGLAADYGRQ